MSERPSQTGSSRAVRWQLPVLVLAVLGAALGVWKLRGESSAPAAKSSAAASERQRVAAVDPFYDPDQPGGGIAGLVRDGDGQPLDGALVAVTRNPGKNELPSFARPTPRTALTAAGGRFRIDDLVPGAYAVTAAASAFTPARNASVTVEPGKTAEVTLSLGKGGALLTGEVLDVGGGAVAGARATLRASGFMLRPGEPTPLYQVVANDRGVFKVRLAPGEYDVTVSAEGYAPARDRLFLSGAQDRRYRLNPAARLSGRVLDRGSKQPVAGAGVWLRVDRLEGFVDRNATSDAEGRFTFDDLAAGGYVVLARAEHRVGLAQAVTVGVAQAVDGVEIFIERGRRIRGTVVDGNDRALGGVRVSANRSDPPYERAVFARSDDKGAFAIEGLLPAKYRVNAWAESGLGIMTEKPETALVGATDVDGVRLVMKPALVVRGQVLDRQGRPVPDAAVSATVERLPASPDQRFAVDRATTDVAGNFTLERLMPGKLTVAAKHPEYGSTKWGPEAVTSAPPPLVLRLEGSASVAGVVKHEDGAIAARMVVFALPQTLGPMLNPPEQAMTDGEGRFQLTNLDKGRYAILARRQSDFMGGTPRSRREVTLESGQQVTGIELVLPNEGKRIAGKVVGADGAAVSGAIVSAGLEREGVSFRMPQREGFPTAPHAVTDADGAFAIDDLQDGKYTLWATDSFHADGERAGVIPGDSTVVIKLDGGASVAGLVATKDGRPVSDYTITALPGGPQGQSPDDRMRLQSLARMWSPSAQVHDPAGTFFIGRLSPGPYQLTVTTAEGQGGLQAVTVAAGEKKTGVVISLDAGVKLVGRVVDLDTQAPLPGVNVMVASPTGRLDGTTAADGSFTITGLNPGHARVDFRLGDGETYVPEHIEIDVTPGAGTLDVGTIRKLKGSISAKRGGSPTTYGRVGVTVSLVDGKPSVTGVRPGFPGDVAGLKQGELVLVINGRATEGFGNGALDYLAAGKLGEPLTLKVQPRAGGAPREVTMERVPVDYDPSRPGSAPPVAAGAQPRK